MKKCGIYLIVNTINRKILVGSSINIHLRWQQHRTNANHGLHHNPHFQSAWNEYGKDAFEFRLQEECLPELLTAREDSWMAFYKTLDPQHGYNMKTATHKLLSNEIRQKISKRHKGQPSKLKGLPFSEEHKLNISIAKKGKPSHRKGLTTSLEVKTKQAEGIARYWSHPENRKAASDRKKGKSTWSKGIPWSPEIRMAHQSHIDSMKGKPSGRKGYQLSDEHKKHISESALEKGWMKGKHLSEETRRKISLANKGRKLSPEHRRALVLFNLGRVATDDARKHMSESHKGKHIPAEQKNKISESLRRTWAKRLSLKSQKDVIGTPLGVAVSM